MIQVIPHVMNICTVSDWLILVCVLIVRCGQGEFMDNVIKKVIQAREINHKGQGLWVSLKVLPGDLKQVGGIDPSSHRHAQRKHTYTHLYIQAYVHAYSHLHTHRQTRSLACSLTHTHIYRLSLSLSLSLSHTHTHTHTYTNTDTQIL